MSVSPAVDDLVAPAAAVGPAGPGGGPWRRIDRLDAARTVFVGVCAAAVGSGLTGPWPQVPVIAFVGLVVGCRPIASEAWGDARERRMSMEASMIIAIVAAAAIGEWVTSLVITAFALAAEILEDLSMDRGRHALTDLMSFLPAMVRVRNGGRQHEVALASVTAGDTVVVPPGERVSVDGTVLVGRSSVDQSRITGESLPVDVAPGAAVYAGSINQLGALEIRAERVGAESSYGRIVEAVRQAQSSPAPVQRLADRLAGWLVYFALTAATVTFVVTRDPTATISVVVVAGACGVAAGTPLAVLAAIARAARSGAFIKAGVHLESLSGVDTIVFDKTGTLTEGVPTVVDVRPASGVPAEEVVSAAASAELYSEHPLGRTIVTHAYEHDLTPARPDTFTYEPGLGLTADVDGRRIQVGNATLVPDAPASVGDGSTTAVHVAVDGAYTGTLLLADTLRESAHRCVSELRALGLRVLLLTGDRETTVRAVAAQVGIDEVRAELLPDHKLAVIDAERAAGHRLAMVGDGVNDSPALARADVGIAMGSGTEVARESADVVLITSDLADLTRTVRTARHARRIVMANFIGTIAVDVLGILLAALGFLAPVLAALIHVGSESAFILNSARLLPGHRTTPRGLRAQREGNSP